MNSQQFIRQSLELHLVFLRLMKEHGLNVAASLPAKNQNLIREAKTYNSRYNSLLSEAVKMSTDVIGMSDAAVTRMTPEIEEKTQNLLGIPIDIQLTKTELEFPKPKRLAKVPTEETISGFNRKVIDVTEQFVLFKTRVINAILECELFSTSYPEMIIHIRLEALDFIDKLNNLEERQIEQLTNDEIMNWNHIMIDHVEFVRGLLDPSEKELFKLTNDLVEEGKAITLGPNFYEKSLALTKKIRDFKEKATELILNCDVRSVIVPLLSDHILREANYYLSILEKYND